MLKHTFKMKLFVFLFLTTYSVWSLNIGDDCMLSSSQPFQKTRGKCAILINCPLAISNLKANINPVVCGFQNFQPIVCCSEKPKVSIRAEIQKKIDNSNRISKQKCVEYGKSVYEQKTILWMGGMRHENVSTCVSDTDTLTSGIYAKAKEYPHMALIGFGPEYDKQWMCSGVLISEQFVLTVAHCTSNRDLWPVQWVRLGDLDFESPNDDSDFLDLKIIATIIHPQFHYRIRYNDIALLKLERKVPFSTYIRPACLYTGNDDALNKFTLTGWSNSASDLVNKGHLQRIKGIKKVPHEECNKLYNSLGYLRTLMNGIDKDTMICTEERRGVYQVSSGAPIQVNSVNVYCMFDVVGISSFGGRLSNEVPAVYTKVSGYIDWIESIVWPQTM